MSGNAMPDHLFTQVVTDVQAVEQLLQEQGYEPGVNRLVSLHPLHLY
ncbi:Aec26 [Salmonella enterica subsp. enterica serovar Sanjuan]|uniref:Aec26 n=1 Tax=Salmonella enterica subsp. enterica serovar Sanjuan TaxID=1160765 RepID=A0A447NJD5_SALET|nr:Aec26 [Salmonella enterica subsp. enterica serovar Sanjuan]